MKILTGIWNNRYLRNKNPAKLNTWQVASHLSFSVFLCRWTKRLELRVPVKYANMIVCSHLHYLLHCFTCCPTDTPKYRVPSSKYFNPCAFPVTTPSHNSKILLPLRYPLHPLWLHCGDDYSPMTETWGSSRTPSPPLLPSTISPNSARFQSGSVISVSSCLQSS